MARAGWICSALGVVAIGCTTPPPPVAFEARLLRGHEMTVEAVSISGDGRLVVSADSGGEVRIWDLAHEHSAPLKLRDGLVRSIAFDPTDAALAVGCDEGTVVLHESIVT